MRLTTMRALDYHLGRPLCFLAGFWLKLKDRSAGDRRKTTPSKRVLFIELSEMGSAVLADAALRWTAARGSEIYFAIFARNAASLELLDTVPRDHVFTLRDSNLAAFCVDFVRFLIWTRRTRIDAVVDLELFSRATALMTALSSARERVGFHAFHSEGLYRGRVFTRLVPYNAHLHIAKNFMALARSLFADGESAPFCKDRISDEEAAPARADVKAESLATVEKTLRLLGAPPSAQWVLLNCGGGEFLPQRRWPAESYVRLARMVLDRHPNVRVLLTGSAGERDELTEIQIRTDREGIFNLAGEIALRDLPALYRVSSLLVTNDSGAAHFASVTDLPTYVFFGPETPTLYGSLGRSAVFYAALACSPCVSAHNHRRTSCTDNRCLRVITPEQVYGAIRRHLVEAGERSAVVASISRPFLETRPS